MNCHCELGGRPLLEMQYSDLDYLINLSQSADLIRTITF